ncbi:hypothetical protein ACWEWI_39355 [Streptomyces sp. NPDC003753]|nr:hypothetical protein [Streptomyces sp. Y2F8-2]
MSILIRLTWPSTTPEFHGWESPGDDGVKVAFEVLSESAETGQAGSWSG